MYYTFSKHLILNTSGTYKQFKFQNLMEKVIFMNTRTNFDSSVLNSKLIALQSVSSLFVSEFYIFNCITNKLTNFGLNIGIFIKCMKYIPTLLHNDLKILSSITILVIIYFIFFLYIINNISMYF